MLEVTPRFTSHILKKKVLTTKQALFCSLQNIPSLKPWGPQNIAHAHSVTVYQFLDGHAEAFSYRGKFTQFSLGWFSLRSKSRLGRNARL